MTDKVQDIFGKIDALLGRRDADVLSERSPENDDFPMLTEVIGAGVSQGRQGPERRAGGLTANGRLLDDRRTLERRRPAGADLSPVTEEDRCGSQIDAIERRLMALLARQRLEIQAVLRSVIRETLSAEDDENL